MQEISQFLQKNKTDAKGTLVSLIHPRGKYFVSPELMDTFWKIYSDCYVDQKLGLAEMQITCHIPVLVDVDLKKEDNSITNGLYTIKHVQRLVQVYQKILREIVRDLPEENLSCFLMEKPPYLLAKGEKTFCKNGFHLHFPYVFLSRYDQETYLLPRVRTECKRLAPNEMPSCVTADTYVDKAYCKGAGIPWLLYGSKKEGNTDGYQVMTVFDRDGKPSNEWKRQLLDYHIYSVDKNRILLDSNNIDIHLPRIFSINPFGREEYIFEINPEVETMRTNIPGVPKYKKANPPKAAAAAEEDLVFQVEKLLPLLSIERATDRNDWILVGWTLFNIFDGSDVGYEYWVQFSKKCAALFDESVCYNEWQMMQKKDITIGTLKFMARADNPEKYEEVAKEFGKNHLEKSLKLDGTHHDLAKALFQRYESEFVCASITNKIWYQFIDHVWRKIEEGVSLRRKISLDIVSEYEAMEKELKKKESTSEGDEESRIKNQRKNVNRLIKSLKSSPYKSNVMKEAMEIFFEDGFLTRLDANPYLIAFQNGVFDLLQHRFRPGRPDDYISTKMLINYREFQPDDPDVLEVEQFFEKIFPDKTVRDYFLNISSEIFVGGNAHKIVQVWTGDGDNGKSVTQNLFEKMLGPYNVKLPTSLIVGKRTQSSSACPELCRAGNGVRFAMVQEPDKKDIINVGILKELSGNDTFFARGLYKEGGEITPMFKLAMICNETPKLPYDDKAAWNRIRVIPFESIFTADAPESYEEQLNLKRFPKDARFADKIPRMIEPFAWLLLERYRSKPRIIVEPPKVMFATNSYRKRNDVFKQFIEELIIEKEDSFLLLNDMYAAFKDWFRESIPQGSMPTKQDVLDYFTKVWGEYDATGMKKWKGYAMRTDFSPSLA